MASIPSNVFAHPPVVLQDPLPSAVQQQKPDSHPSADLLEACSQLIKQTTTVEEADYELPLLEALIQHLWGMITAAVCNLSEESAAKLFKEFGLATLVNKTYSVETSLKIYLMHLCFQGLHDLKTKKNPIRLISFITKNPWIFHKEDYRKNLIKVFESGRIDLLEQPLISFFSDAVQSKSKDFFKNALQSYKRLSSFQLIFAEQALHMLVGSFTLTQDNSLKSGRICAKMMQKDLLSNTVLTERQSKDLWRAYESLFDVISKSINNFRHDLKAILDDIIKNYSKIIIHYDAKGQTDFDKDFHSKHREVFESFIPRIKELIDWIIKAGRQVEDELSVLACFQSYIKKDGLISLQKKLSQKNYYRSGLLNLLKQEIKEFIPRCDESKLCLFERELLKTKSIHVQIAAYAEILLGGPLKAAEEFTRFLTVPLTVHLPHFSEPTDEKGEKDEQIVTSTHTQEEVLGRWQTYQQAFRAEITHVCKEVTGFGAAESLGNARYQQEDMLLSIIRMSKMTETPISRKHLASLIVGIVGMGTLACEQTLSAIDRETNQIKSAQELSERLSYDSHNLVRLLYSCKFTGRPLQQISRNLIHEYNFGERHSRYPTACTIHGNTVEKLLAKTRLWALGDSAFSTQHIVEEMLRYTKNAVVLCLELNSRIGRGESLPELKNQFFAFHRMLADNVLALTFAESDDITIPKQYRKTEKELKQIAGTIQQFASNPSAYVRESSENILRNYLVVLETEISYQSILSPSEARLHASKILLQCQITAEEFLYMSLYLRDIKVDTIELDHNLLDMTLKLGMRKSDFSKEEIEFLSRGKDIRMHTRYLASHQAKYGFGKKGVTLAMDNAHLLTQSAQPAKVWDDIQKILQTEIFILHGIVHKIASFLDSVEAKTKDK